MTISRRAIPPKPRGDELNILITGGSQGSRTLNRAARQSWPLFRKAGFRVRILHQSGPSGFDALREDFANSGIAGEIVPTPGHSDDSVSLLLDDGSVFAGDLTHPALADEDAAPIVTASWDLLRDRGATRIYPGHGSVRPMHAQ